MGKKSDAQLKAISEKSDACIKTGNTLLKVLQVWPPLNAEWDKWEPEMLKLPDYEKHPYIIKRYAVWEKGKELSGQLRSEMQALTHAVDDFRNYLAKKEKSKNPFKSKASLPGSKALVKLYDKVLKDYSGIVTLGSKAFH